MKVITIVFAFLFFAFSAIAQQAPAKKEPARQMRGPCAEDAAKFCKDTPPGGGRIIACLQGQGDKLSPACKAQMSKTQDRRQERRQERKQEQQKKAAPSVAPAAPDATKK